MIDWRSPMLGVIACGATFAGGAPSGFALGLTNKAVGAPQSTYCNPRNLWPPRNIFTTISETAAMISTAPRFGHTSFEHGAIHAHYFVSLLRCEKLDHGHGVGAPRFNISVGRARGLFGLTWTQKQT